jgi:hypothetical protein
MPLMKNLWLIALFFSALAVPRSGAQASVNSEKARIEHLTVSSKRLRSTKTQAEGRNQNRISFDVFSSDATLPYQAYTTPLEGDDKKGSTVHVVGGLPDQLTELLIAHELFHIVLKNQGWPTQVNSSLSRQELETTFKGAIAKDTNTALMSCYPDCFDRQVDGAEGLRAQIDQSSAISAHN